MPEHFGQTITQGVAALVAVEGLPAIVGTGLGLIRGGQKLAESMETAKPVETAPWQPPQQALDKLKDFGNPVANKKGEGLKWNTPHGKDNIRIDKGDPNAQYSHQQVDHVRVNKGGQVIGRDGNPILKSDTNPYPKNAPEAHIPLSEWINWTGSHYK